MSAVRTLNLCLVPSHDDALRRARSAGERIERQRVVAYLVGLEEDDSYELQSPGTIADRLLCGAHHRGGK